MPLGLLPGLNTALADGTLPPISAGGGSSGPATANQGGVNVGGVFAPSPATNNNNQLIMLAGLALLSIVVLRLVK